MKSLKLGLIVLLLQLVSCKREFLISVEDKDSVTWITVFHESPDTVPEVQTSIAPLKLSGHVSKGCGKNFFRCEKLLIVETSPIRNGAATLKKEYIMFIPLEHQVYLVELVYNGSTESMYFGEHYGIPTTRCSPTAIYKMVNGFYTVCVNMDENYISLFEIRLNKTSLKNSYILPMPNEEYSIPSDHGNITNASNYLYMEWNNNDYIFFAVNNNLYAIRPLEGSIDFGFAPIGASCRHVNELALTGNDGEILAYCNDFIVYYSIDLADWTLQDNYDNAGRPYVCPDKTVHLSVYAEESYITYNIATWKQDVTISGSFHSGICYGSANHSLFAYLDQQRGVFVLDTLTAEVFPIYPISCLETECQPLRVIENRYMITHSSDNDGGTVLVINVASNFSVIIEAQHTTPALVTVIDVNLNCTEQLTTCTQAPWEPKFKGKDNKTKMKIAVPIVILAAVSIIFVVVLLLVVYFKYSREQVVPPPIQEGYLPGGHLPDGDNIPLVPLGN